MEVIKNKQIAFVRVSELNDPFDPYYFFETDFRADYQELIARLEKNHPRDMLGLRNNLTSQMLDEIVEIFDSYMRYLRKTTFVLSTSAAYCGLHPKDNLYMWGHYANGHRGIAIEFNTQALTDAVLKHHETENGAPFEESGESNVWAKIKYAKTVDPITAEHVYEYYKNAIHLTREQFVKAPTQLNRYFRCIAKIKSVVWKSESEWRLMWCNDETEKNVYKCPIGKDVIVNVFMGLRLAQDKSEELIVAARQNFPTASILCAHKRHGALALEFRHHIEAETQR
jgi:Protein of unknown function (DUF2971).